MHIAFVNIKSELEQLVTTIKTVIPSNEPFGIAHGNWSFPGLTRDELAQLPASLATLIDARGGDEIKDNEALLLDYVRRISFLRTNTIPNLWGNPGVGVPTLFLTLDGLKNVLESTFNGVGEEALDTARALGRLKSKLRSVEATLDGLDPRSSKLSTMVERIEHAYEAADQLPTDLVALGEARDQIRLLAKDAAADKGAIEKLLEEIRSQRRQAEKSALEAAAIIERCDDAYRATTSEGLASVFAERSKEIARSMWVWVFGFIIALVAGGAIGGKQLGQLTEVLKPSTQFDVTVWINIFLSLLSIGAPVWFGWMASKQIGHRFRLAEDYGYKAAISKAYEGYRREAALLDPAFQARLFASALSRLEELPLRLVETDTHGSPWHELFSSDIVRQAAGAVPGFANKVTELAQNTLAAISKERKLSSTPAALDVAPTPSEKAP